MRGILCCEQVVFVLGLPTTSFLARPHCPVLYDADLSHHILLATQLGKLRVITIGITLPIAALDQRGHITSRHTKSTWPPLIDGSHTCQRPH